MNESINPEDILKIVEPLDPILADNRVWEIMIDSHERILVERDGRIEQVESPFASAAELEAMIKGLFTLYGIQLGAANPIGYLRLPDHSRCMAVLPPNAVDAPYFVLRRVMEARPTWTDLLGWGSLPQGAYDLINEAIAAQANILVAGGAGSGKTTVAGLIVDAFPAEERVIVVEQDYEIQVTHPRAIRLEAGGPAGLTMEDILTAATRMRPDRLVVGNLDGPIAATVLHHFGLGLGGSLTQMHGTSVLDALHRLETFCLMANLGLGLPEIRQLIASGLQLIIYQQNLSEQGRKIVEMVELQGVENHRYLLQPLMRYDLETEQFTFTGIKPSWQVG